MLCKSAAANDDNNKNGDDDRIYEAPNGCPLADFERYLTEEAAPQSPAAACYTSAETRRRLGCTHDTVLTPADATAAKGQQYSSEAAMARQTCYWYRQQCPAWACARSGEGKEKAGDNDEVPANTIDDDYALIASGSASVPFALDVASNNCVRRLTPAWAARLSAEEDRAAKATSLAYGLGAAAAIALAGFAGLVLLLTRLAKRRNGGGVEDGRPVESMRSSLLPNEANVQHK